MSGTVGGRTSVASRAVPHFVPRPASAAEVGAPCCGFTDDLGNISATGGGTPAHAYEYFLDTTGVPCSADMAMTAQVTEWTTDNNGAGSLQLDVRYGGSGGHIGVELLIDEIAASANATYRLTYSDVGSGGSIVGTSTLAKPIAGDTFELRIIGSTATVYRNDAVLFTSAISGVDMPTTSQPCAMAFVSPGGSGGPYVMSADITFESFCS